MWPLEYATGDNGCPHHTQTLPALLPSASPPLFRVSFPVEGLASHLFIRKVPTSRMLRDHPLASQNDRATLELCKLPINVCRAYGIMHSR